MLSSWFWIKRTNVHLRYLYYTQLLFCKQEIVLNWPFFGTRRADAMPMAEGHAVIRWARALQQLAGEALIAVRLPQRWGDRGATLLGAQLTAIETRGKHLLLHLSTGDTIHTHAMQYGSWQVGERGMALRKDARYVRLRLVTSRHEAIFYHGPVIEVLTAEELAQHGALLALGPDVMSSQFDRDDVARRIAVAGERPIGDVVLDQRVVAGLGNIFKSEGLFLAGVDPRRSAASISRGEQDRLWDAIVPIMWRGTERFGKTTTTTPELQAQGHLHYVYRRRGHPCLACGNKIQMVRQGELDRSTYFCPVCQQ
jgi:endonuclease VIII